MHSGEGLTKTFNIPISHLDFDYVGKCTDVKELEKIYVTLKIGEEGKYPELESCCEEKLKQLCPESRVLRKPTELKTTEQLDKEQRDQLTNDFQAWLAEVQSKEESITKLEPTERGDGIASKSYPIRGKNTMPITEVKDNPSEKRTNKKSCKPKDYNEWSKIADQLEKQMIVEEAEEQQPKPKEKEKTKSEDKKCKQIPNLENKVDTTGLSESDKERLALSEKDKGNEAFRAGDLDEADIYYCRSLSILPNTPVYNNRGLIHMKQKKWAEAIRDFNIVIKREPSNIKALMRRATCYSEIHNLQDAIIDCQKIIKLSPSNKAAEALLHTSQEELQKRAQPKLKDGRRMVITEIGSDDEGSDDEVSTDEIVPVDTQNANEQIKVSEKSTSEQLEDISEQAFMALKDEGNELFKELKYEDALATYAVLTKRWPSNPIGYRNKAACNLILERYEDVIDDCTIAIDLDKTSHLSFYRRGKAYKGLKQYEKSLNDLEEALQISPNHKQINEELNEVLSLIHDEKIATEKSAKEARVVTCVKESEPVSEDSETTCEIDPDNQKPSSPVSGTWELVDEGDYQTSSEKQDELDTSIIIVGDVFNDSPSVTVTTIERSSTNTMTKYEFDKKIGSIKAKFHWTSVIQLLVDVEPSNLAKLMGEKLDGFLLEHIIESLVVYSSNESHASFILSVLEQLVKVNRFSFVKMMLSDHTLSELELLFEYLKRSWDNLAQVDSLRLKYL